MNAVLNSYDYLIARAEREKDPKLKAELTAARERYLDKATKPE